MSFLQPWLLIALPLALLPIIIHLINQWRYQTKRWGAMMFLLAANRMSRGYAKLRQWLILAMRMLAIAGLVFAISRPLSSGLLGMGGGGRPDTTIVLLDRSPSMMETGASGQSKLETGKRQLWQALRTIGSGRWILVNQADSAPQTYDTIESLADSPATQGTSATTDLPGMMQAALDYLKNNQSGPSEIWICSDLRAADWNVDSGTWNAVRQAFKSLPQSVRFRLLSYAQRPNENYAIRVTDVRRDSSDGNAVLISMQLSNAAGLTSDSDAKKSVPIQIDIEGARTELTVEMVGSQLEIRDHRVPLAGSQRRGWGKISLPADANNADNEFYFVFDDPPPRRVVVVSEDRDATRALEIAASVAPDGKSLSTVDVIAPENLDSLVLDATSLLLWQTSLPDAAMARAIEAYIQRGGQVIFFPPSSVTSQGGIQNDFAFMSVRWKGWSGAENKVLIENWRGDQDLLAATRSGAGLPVGQLELNGYAKIEGEYSKLATLSGGDPLLARVPTERGGVYFCTASTEPDASSLATNGIVLYITIQRAIQQGQESLGGTTQKIAGTMQVPTDGWQQVAGPRGVLSTEYGLQSGVYSVGDGWLALNRAVEEDQREIIDDGQLNRLFAGLDFTRVDDQAGGLAGLVREIWRLFLISMIVAMLTEAVLCMPRVVGGVRN